MIEQQIKHYRALDEWFRTPLGSYIAHEFTSDLMPVTDFLKGETLLQLANCNDNPWLKSLDFNHKWVASPYSAGCSNQIECSLNQIPLSRNSIDCVIVPLALEPFGNNFTLLDEIDRILNPMGYIVFLCINPWSLWGGAMNCGLLPCYHHNKVKMRTPFNLNRIMVQRGYRNCSLSNFCYIPPINNKSIIKKLTFLDEVGRMLWPFPSGFYCYIAQKYELIRPSLMVAPVLQPNYKSPLQPALNNWILDRKT